MPPFATDQLRKIFIGGLNLETTEEGLKQYFSRWGECVDVVVMRFPDTKKSRGFGFVTYEKVESVDAVLDAKPHFLDGKDIEPKRAVAKEETPQYLKEEAEKCQKVFVGGLASATTEDDIRNCFTKFCEEAGRGSVEEVMIMRDRDNNDRLRGFGFVTFDSPEIVDKVCSVKYFEIRTKTVEVRRAESRMAMKKKEEKEYGYSRRRMDDRRRDMNDGYQGSGKMRGGNFFGSGFNPMAMQAAMSGGNGMPFFGGFGGGNSGGSRGGSGGFGGGMNPMALAGMMSMLASSMGMNMGNMGNMGMNNAMGGGGSGMGMSGGGGGAAMGMSSSGDGGRGGGGDSSYRSDMGDSYRGTASNSGAYKSNVYSGENVNTGNTGSSDVAVGYGSQNSSAYNEQATSGMADMSGYANAMSAMFGAAGVSPANVQAALYNAYGGNAKSEFGAYNDQTSSMYGPSRGSSTGKATSTSRGYKPY